MGGKFGFAIVWWIITVVIICLVLLPIYLNIGNEYRFYTENIFYIFLFITFTRFIFFTKYHWFSHKDIVKVAFVFMVIPIILILVDSLYEFQSFMDNEGINSIMKHLPLQTQDGLSQYIKTEMLLFWVGSMITSFMLPFRMIHSIWRLRHRGKV